MTDRLKVVKEEDHDPWYKKGLPFECTGCGQCCTGAPGYVWVSLKEIEMISEYLKITPKEFKRLYVRQVGDRLSLTERANFDCVFLKDKKCRVYGARPRQCQTFPFWKQNLKSPEAWEEIKKECEGIRDHCKTVPFEDIEEQLDDL